MVDNVRLSNEQKIIALEKAITQATENINRVVQNDQQSQGELENIKRLMGDIKTLVYGSVPLRLEGIADRVKNLETEVFRLQEERKSLIAQISGARKAVIFLGITSTGALGAFLTDLIK